MERALGRNREPDVRDHTGPGADEHLALLAALDGPVVLIPPGRVMARLLLGSIGLGTRVGWEPVGLGGRRGSL